MYAAASIDDLSRYYRYSPNPVVNGVWSVLICSSSEQGAEFADRYFEAFNEVVRDHWHLAVFAKYNHCDEGQTWIADSGLHAHAENIRQALSQGGKSIPNLAIVFFDPNQVSFGQNSLIIPLDSSKIGNKQFYLAGFERAHQSVVRAFEGLHLSPYAQVPPALYNDLLERIRIELNRTGIKARVAPIAKSIVEAFVGAFFGKMLGA